MQGWGLSRVVFHPGVELRENLKSNLPKMPPLRGGICIGVDEVNHPFAPGLSQGFSMPCPALRKLCPFAARRRELRGQDQRHDRQGQDTPSR